MTLLIHICKFSEVYILQGSDNRDMLYTCMYKDGGGAGMKT